MIREIRYHAMADCHDDETIRTMTLSKEQEARRARLQEARVAAGYKNARATAHKLGLSESTYRSHENGTRPITQSVARAYASAFKIHFKWLWDGAGAKDNISDDHVTLSHPDALPNGNFETIHMSSSPSYLPVRGRARGGQDGEIVLDGTIMQMLPGPSTLKAEDGAYGIEVVGESMEIRFKPKQIVWVDPKRPVHKGDDAVFQVRDSSGELVAFVKEFRGYSNGRVMAWQHNPPGEVSWDRDDVEEIHLIVGTGVR